MKKQKIVTIGGGSGQYALLTALRDIEGIDISAIVSMTDSGGSTGRLRDELGVLPPGDILKCIIALSPYRQVARELFQTRFNGENTKLKGHNVGNLLLTLLARHTDHFTVGVEALSEILKIKGRVMPVTIDRATLVAELDNGERIYGEAAIDQPGNKVRQKINNVYLVPHHSGCVMVYEPVLEAIAEADFIILGPGDLYTSVMPNLKVPGVAEALQKSAAKIIYVSNIMTKFGETDGFSLGEFVKQISNAIGRQVDYVVANDRRPSEEFLAKYIKERADFVEPELPEALEINMITADLLDDSGEVLRHGDEKLRLALSQVFLV